MKCTLLFLFCFVILVNANGQHLNADQSLLRTFKPAYSKGKIENIDLDQDSDPNLKKVFINDGIPAFWIDEDKKNIGLQGDCLIIDKNNDGIFAGLVDISLNWVDNDQDGIADMQEVVENSNPKIKNYWD